MSDSEKAQNSHGVKPLLFHTTGPPPYDIREFVCGWGAGVINITVTFPINKIIFRQQLHGIKTGRAFSELRNEGLLHLYRGLKPPLIQKTTNTALMFGMYDTYQCIIWRHYPDCPGLLAKTVSAILAGSTEALLCPLERVQTLLQNKYYHDHYKNTLHAFQELRCYGVKEYYRGLSAILLRNGPSNVVFFLLRGDIKDLFPHHKGHVSEFTANFVSGAILGASISTVCYPLNVVKVRMQEHVGGEFPSIRQVFLRTFNERDRSWRRMFRGAHINFTRSLISWGIINASYEILKAYMYRDSSA